MEWMGQSQAYFLSVGVSLLPTTSFVEKLRIVDNFMRMTSLYLFFLVK